MENVVVIGAGQAGFSVCAALRNKGFGGRITLIGSETMAPYQRPPLSKAYLKGEISADRLLLKPLAFYAEQDIDLRPGTRVAAIDRGARRIDTSAGPFAYDALVLTTGSQPRRLPDAVGGDLDHVHYLRDRTDSDALAGTMAKAARLVIVGGGYIGLEVAAVLARAGKEVTVVEAGGRILQRVAAAETSDFVRALHARHGVVIREGVGLDRLEGSGAVSHAVLSDGTSLATDAAVIGIGAIASDGLARDAGLACSNGIEVDLSCRTSDPAIWAAGDCCCFELGGRRIRLESVQNAVDQAETVAANILGEQKTYAPTPWFWSDQYDMKLQIAGLNLGFDRTVLRETPESGARSVWYFDGPRFIAVDAMNDPRSYMVGRKCLEEGRTVDYETIQPSEFELRNLLLAK